MMIGQWLFMKNKKIGFENIKEILKRDLRDFVIITTIPAHDQICLIQGTTPIHLEEKVINDLLENYEMKRRKMVIYGKNCLDEQVEKKSKQLVNLGFSEVYVYVGGMFEWLLLQDIYGEDEFPTTTKITDLLKYRPEKVV